VWRGCGESPRLRRAGLTTPRRRPGGVAASISGLELTRTRTQRLGRQRALAIAIYFILILYAYTLYFTLYTASASSGGCGWPALVVRRSAFGVGHYTIYFIIYTLYFIRRSAFGVRRWCEGWPAALACSSTPRGVRRGCTRALPSPTSQIHDRCPGEGKQSFLDDRTAARAMRSATVGHCKATALCSTGLHLSAQTPITQRLWLHCAVCVCRSRLVGTMACGGMPNASVGAPGPV